MESAAMVFDRFAKLINLQLKPGNRVATALMLKPQFFERSCVLARRVRRKFPVMKPLTDAYISIGEMLLLFKRRNCVNLEAARRASAACKIVDRLLEDVNRAGSLGEHLQNVLKLRKSDE